VVPKNQAMIRDGWEGITDPAKIAKYRKITAELLAEEYAKRKRK